MASAMECPICCGDIMEAPANGSSSPPTKKSKTNGNSQSQSESDSVCLPCGHMFHRECIMKWFAQGSRTQGKYRNAPTSGTCPTCRNAVTVKQLYPAYLTMPKNSSSSAPAATAQNNPSTGSQSSSSSGSSSSVPTPASAIKTRATSSSSCTNESCCDMRMLFDLLEQDFQELQKELNEERARADFNQAVVDSFNNSPATARQDSNHSNPPNDTTTESKTENAKSDSEAEGSPKESSSTERSGTFGGLTLTWTRLTKKEETESEPELDGTTSSDDERDDFRDFDDDSDDDS